MHSNSSRLALVAVLAASLTTLAGCPKGGLPSVPGRGGASSVNPNTCGNYAAKDAGRKLKDFLEATVQLQTTADETEKVVKQSCIIMGQELQMAEANLTGDTKGVCNKVITTIQQNLKVSVKSQAALNVHSKPAVCKVDVQLAAHAAAQCEGKADADVSAKCSGTCNGTCNGKCNGKAGTGGNSGECNGTCDGTCSGDCDGSADVNASAQCKASAEAKASADVKCSEPEFSIDLDAKLVIDPTTAERTVKALTRGIPEMMSVKRRLQPVSDSLQGFIKASGNLASASVELTRSLDDQARCVSGQIGAAVSAIGHIKASVSVSVEVSASASGSAGI